MRTCFVSRPFSLTRRYITIGCCLLIALATLAHVAAADVDSPAVTPPVKAFFAKYCSDCHGAETQEADFRVDTMLKVSATAVDAEYWQLVLDNLNLGEMPPEGEQQPTDREREAVTEWIDQELRRARKALAGHSGEVVLRRLNRTEYEYTIEDLFGVRGDFTSGFPADATAEGFDNNGAALMLSSEQVTQYMQAADFVINRAIQTGKRPKTNRSVFTLHDFNREAWNNQRKQLERRKQNFDSLTPAEQKRTREMIEKLKTNPHDGFSFPVWQDGKLRAPTPDDGPEVDGVIAIKAGYAAPDTRRVFTARTPGWYRFRITAYAASHRGEPVRLKISYGSFRQGTIPEVADIIQLTDSTPRDFHYRLYLQPHNLVKMEMIDGTNWAPREKLVELPGPFVAIQSMEMEGPLFDQWPPAGHRFLLGTRETESLNDGDVPAILSELGPRLFRRPAKESVVEEFVSFYAAAREQQLSPLDAFKLTVKAMMASPHFVYHVEPEQSAASFNGKPKATAGPTGKNTDASGLPLNKSAIDEYALANRLSYFLWRSAPDATLYELAKSGRLSDPGVLRTQVDRLLADKRSERFLKDFTGQWLGIDLVGDMQPDGNLYPEYDDSLERAMVQETQAFIRELLHKDETLTNLIDSKWAMLNDRLARHYGIDGVDGNHFRRVPLKESDTVRGGLLTQASILNITSNGTTTSPVVRGVWVLERLLGTPAPAPPPDVPAIEPDIRGASTIQEQLERHRSIAQCASCHRRIDPYGIALENFDVIGGWRENYRALEPTANPNRPKLVDGPAVISSDNMPRQGRFDNFRQFRKLLLEQDDLVHRNVARQLATFALGRSMDFSDEEDIHNIASATQSRSGGMKTMIRELVTSRLFGRR